MTNTLLTQERLKEVLHYNKDSGIFTWKLRTSNRVKVGDIAGSIGSYGYLHITIDTVSYRAHRLAFLYMTGCFPEYQCDHIDHNRINNSWINLRSVTNKENSLNKSRHKKNTSGIIGVRWYEPRNRFISQIVINKRTVDLGRHKDFFEACCARKSAEAKLGYHKNHGGI